MNYIKTVLKSAAVVVGVLVVISLGLGLLGALLSAANVGNDPNDAPLDRKQDDVQVSAPAESDRMGADIRQAFIGGCTAEGVSYSECACMYDYLDTNYTNAQFERIMDDVLDGNLNTGGNEAIYACM